MSSSSSIRDRLKGKLKLLRGEPTKEDSFEEAQAAFEKGRQLPIREFLKLMEPKIPVFRKYIDDALNKTIDAESTPSLAKACLCVISIYVAQENYQYALEILLIFRRKGIRPYINEQLRIITENNITYCHYQLKAYGKALAGLKITKALMEDFLVTNCDPLLDNKPIIGALKNISHAIDCLEKNIKPSLFTLIIPPKYSWKGTFCTLVREETLGSAMAEDKDAQFKMASLDPKNADKWYASAAKNDHELAQATLVIQRSKLGELKLDSDGISVNKKSVSKPEPRPAPPVVKKKKKNKKKSLSGISNLDVSYDPGVAEKSLKEVEEKLEEFKSQLAEEEKVLGHSCEEVKAKFQGKTIALGLEIVELNKQFNAPEKKLEELNKKNLECLKELALLRQQMTDIIHTSETRVEDFQQRKELEEERKKRAEEREEKKTESKTELKLDSEITISGLGEYIEQHRIRRGLFFHFNREAILEEAKNACGDPSEANNLTVQVRRYVSNTHSGGWGVHKIALSASEDEHRRFPGGYKVRIPCRDKQLPCRLRLATEQEEARGMKEVISPSNYAFVRHGQKK
jgi:hypothetical protein